MCKFAKLLVDGRHWANQKKWKKERRLLARPWALAPGAARLAPQPPSWRGGSQTCPKSRTGCHTPYSTLPSPALKIKKTTKSATPPPLYPPPWGDMILTKKNIIENSRGKCIDRWRFIGCCLLLESRSKWQTPMHENLTKICLGETGVLM